MAKKWSEVISSPDYQALSAPEKADAQAQYFNQVVKPNLSESEVDAAHAQFYKQYPVGATGATTAPSSTTPNPTTQPQANASQEATQEPTEGEDKSSLTYALHHPGEAFSALGNDLALGAAHWLTTDHSTGQETAPQGAAHDWYVQNMADPETRKNALASEEALKMGGQIAAYTSGAGAVEALGMAGLKGFVASNVAGSLASQAVGDQGFSVGQTAQDVATAGLLHGAAKVVGSTVSGLRNVLPESLGGYSTAEKAADVANPDYVEKVLQGGNQNAQEAFRTATTDANGNSIILPSQALKGRYVNAEYRDMMRGENSQFNPLLAQQQSGEGLEKAVTNANSGSAELQPAAQDITNQFKKQSTDLYQNSKQQAQGVLDSMRIKSLKMPDTKQIASDALAEHERLGAGLTGEARRTLQQFKKSTINNIDDLDTWKRVLNEKAGKAYRNGDYQSAAALRETVNSLRNEADSVITRINPDAGSIYKDADKYFSESVGDFGNGKKSVFGKIASAENPDTAGNPLLRGQNKDFNTQQTADALDNALSSGSLDDAARLSLNFGQGLGSATRSAALDAGNSGANFSPTKFANRLNQLTPQAEVAAKYSPDELAVNNALRDAVGLTRQKASSVGRVTSSLASMGGRIAGATTGAVAGSVLPVVGNLAGGYAGERAAKFIGEGALDRMIGTNKLSSKYINFLSDPANAQKVSDILANRGGLNASTKDITSAIDALTGAQSGYHSLNAPTTQPTYNPAAMPLQNEPEQHTQSARSVSKDSDSFDPRVTKLYKALASAETGGLDNRFIRTKAAEAGVSTAYGAAQLTTNTMKDFYKRHPEQFNAQERDYIKRFIDQGEKMKRAPKNDPVFGYGGSGVLGGKEDRKLYARVARKMLAQMIKDNGGSLDKTVRQWRGADDHAYFSKVRSAFRAA